MCRLVMFLLFFLISPGYFVNGLIGCVRPRGYKFLRAQLN